MNYELLHIFPAVLVIATILRCSFQPPVSIVGGCPCSLVGIGIKNLSLRFQKINSNGTASTRIYELIDVP